MGQVTAKAGGPLVLILAPTRELAKQTEEVASKYRRITGIKTVCCIGGEGRSVISLITRFSLYTFIILQDPSVEPVRFWSRADDRNPRQNQ